MRNVPHLIRVVLLIAAAVAVLSWDLRHIEATSADGLRSVQQAEQIDRGEWKAGMVGAIEHPLHPLGIVAAHALVGGTGPIAWQRAAVALAFGAVILLVIPVYLLARDMFGDGTAWLATLLLTLHPALGQVVANVQSESTFLLFWTWGLWASFRFLREGRFSWLLLTVFLGTLGYLDRPEGLLLPVALVATLICLPLCRSARINWQRWRTALSLVVLGSMLLVGPYMMMEGGPGSRPAVSRILGLLPSAPSEAIERDEPLSPGQPVSETYRLATMRVIHIVNEVIPWPGLCLAGIGLALMPAGMSRTRSRLLIGWILLLSFAGLVRLHATGGYGSPRHALIPGSILILAAAHGMTILASRISISGHWFGNVSQRYRPGPVVWALLIAALILTPRLRQSTYAVSGPYSAYRDTGIWLSTHATADEGILDITDWSLYLSGQSGKAMAGFHEAREAENLRWVVVRQPQLEGHQSYTKVLRDLLGDRKPLVRIPAQPAPGQLQVWVYDRQAPMVSLGTPSGTGSQPSEPSTRR